MDSIRWQEIEELFNTALGLPADEREAFLDAACARDAELRREVDSLISQVSEPDNLLTGSAFTLGAQLLAKDPDKDFEGSNFGTYRIVRSLGSGGMGRVFLAEDATLKRMVALKVLPAALTGAQESTLRFNQEARAASAISHPNIAHIYEFGEVDGRHYLTMEFVEGKTLRELITKTTIDPAHALDIAMQVAQALQAAHGSGVIHRDIKPENIILRPDGYVKVLDFGLAKLIEAQEHGSTGKDTSSLDTSPGLIMGTTAYMSPEQIRGDTVDARTDLWSLGVVFYEMLTGQRPFAGRTPSDVSAAILRSDPAMKPEQVAAEIQEIILRALAKEVSHRYQSAHELLTDLRAASQESGWRQRSGNAPARPTETLNRALTQPTERQRTFLAHRRWLRSGAVIAIILVLLALSVTVTWYVVVRRKSSTAVGQVVRMTNTGRAVRSAISADGRFIAYAIEVAGQQGLFVREAKTSVTNMQIVAPAALEFVGVAFSPDGNYLYYGVKPADEVIAALYRVPSFGGTPVKLLTDLDSAPSFSPDGKRFAFLRLSEDGSHEDLCIANADGTGEQVAYSRRMPEFMASQTQPSWSPDGSQIALAAGVYENGERHMRPVAFRPADGTATPLTSKQWAEVAQTAWLPNGTGLIVTARVDESQDVKQLWRISYPSGDYAPLTNDYNDYYGVSLSSDGQRLITLALGRTASLWTTSIVEGALPQQLSFGSDDGYGLSWTSQNEIVYGSNAGGNPDIWIMNHDGSNRRQLTDDPHSDTDPAVSPNGMELVFTSTRTGGRHLWAMDTAGRSQRQLSNGTGELTPAFTADGKELLYYSFNAGVGALWRVTLHDGNGSVIATGTPRFPAASPDGQWLAFAYRVEGSTENKIAIVRADDPKSVVRIFDPVKGARSPGPLRWTRDSQALSYIVQRKGVGNIWIQPLNSSTARQVTNFTENRIYAFDWSPHGEQLACARGDAAGYVVMLTLQ
jgi:serine/threonine protein kinase/Tol biopolymer transport system component